MGNTATSPSMSTGTASSKLEREPTVVNTYIAAGNATRATASRSNTGAKVKFLDSIEETFTMSSTVSSTDTSLSANISSATGSPIPSPSTISTVSDSTNDIMTTVSSSADPINAGAASFTEASMTTTSRVSTAGGAATSGASVLTTSSGATSSADEIPSTTVAEAPASSVTRTVSSYTLRVEPSGGAGTLSTYIPATMTKVSVDGFASTSTATLSASSVFADDDGSLTTAYMLQTVIVVPGNATKSVIEVVSASSRVQGILSGPNFAPCAFPLPSTGNINMVFVLVITLLSAFGLLS
ncbi:hypothetical protein K437DRAFT_123586 [Tilletiaria anomala UBC 951]|uniref:Uncharacterized protein n=1 Tax=Tilletiaria anomala (strain ATCC 24038 / CBS 436.72 / UBC 951) TaxID=1037660 RepID=A0A066VUA5_TILAU|nr:uncharacterized protein K437DRAFT_123586 [Tilletiaria anomala UBC 951]KDN45307.1 hypothetical protein K437DRAFT_123586 [Tilletiaria anomala UBC 951]